MTTSQPGPGPSSSVESVLLYLMREPASLPKIAFDLRLTTQEAAQAVQELRQRGLVEEAGGAITKGMASQEAPSPGAVIYLSERGVDAAKRIMSRATL